MIIHNIQSGDTRQISAIKLLSIQDNNDELADTLKLAKISNITRDGVIPNIKIKAPRKTSEDSAASTASKFDEGNLFLREDIVAATVQDFIHLADDDKSKSYVLLTADDTVDDIKSHIQDFNKISNIVIYVTDFKDGRVFSLIRQIRKISTAFILIAGEFGLDQAAYFYKSGADAFLVEEDKSDTLKNTLNDLKTAHFGQSANSLPMFR